MVFVYLSKPVNRTFDDKSEFPCDNVVYYIEYYLERGMQEALKVVEEVEEASPVQLQLEFNEDIEAGKKLSKHNKQLKQAFNYNPKDEKTN